MPTTLSEIQRLGGIVGSGLTEGFIKSLKIRPTIAGRQGGLPASTEASVPGHYHPAAD